MVGLVAAAWCQVHAGGLTLVSEGQPQAVLIAAETTNAIRAATAIQAYVRQITGATLPLAVEGQEREIRLPVTVLVGPTRAARELQVAIPSGFDPGVRPDAFAEEGYVFKTADSVLVVAGNDDGPYQGTLYAAYALLERLGCRFYFPGAWGEVVPEQPTLVVPDLDVVSRPDFPMRCIWLSGWVPKTREEADLYENDWCPKVGLMSGRGLYPLAFDGSLAGPVPPKDYAEPHPEFFALNPQGQRPITAKTPPVKAMLCLSNTNMFETYLRNVRDGLEGRRTVLSVNESGVGISPPDGAPYCFCPECQAMSQNFQYPTYIHRAMQSEEYFGFAARLAREFPDRWVATMAYALREMPPQGVTLSSNMAVTLAPISCCVLHPNNHPACWRRQEFARILDQWRRRTPHVIIRDYTPGFLTGMWVPERDAANMASQVPHYKQIGIKGFRREGRKAFMQTWITYYLCAKLFWDAGADVEALKRDFYQTFFGPAAGPHVQAWWEACEEALLASTAHVHEDWLINHIYTSEFVAGIRRHVEAAQASFATDAQRGRIQAFTLIADHLAAYADMNEAERRLDYAAAADACRRMTECKDKLNAIYSFFITVNRNNPRPAFAEGRQLRFEKLAALLDGREGRLVAPLPLEMKFRRDRFNEGVLAEWYAPGCDDSNWDKKNTYYTWDQQDAPEDEKGHDYDGYGWYRSTFEVPADFAGKPVRLWLGGVLNEGWVWINGRYAGHKPHALWWSGDRELDLDISSLVTPGRPNTLAIRIWNDAEIGGLYRRGFAYSPVRSEPALD
jgi:hypothetical protein